MKYLIIDEDGSPSQVDKMPDDNYLQEVVDGTLSIYRFNNSFFEGAEVSVEENDDDEREFFVEWISV